MNSQKMTRKRALELAQECIAKEMRPIAFDANVAINDENAAPVMHQRAARYAELAAALKLIEYMARQKELL